MTVRLLSAVQEVTSADPPAAGLGADPGAAGKVDRARLAGHGRR
jgi:hypothetical protein